MTPLLLLTALLGAGTAAQSFYAEGVPETGQLTCRTAHYTVSFSAERAWTIFSISCDGKPFDGSNGFHNTVLVPQGGKWIGTGHTEGGREVVTALKLTVDGADHPIKVGETVTGHSILLHKESMIWKLKAVEDVTITDDYVVERTQLQATEDCALGLMYYFMHCFVPSTTRWLALLPDNTFSEGPLGVTDGFVINRDTRWVAEYEPNWQAGIIAYTPRIIAGPGSCSMIWDKANYHKYYLRSNQARTLKAGETLDYSVVIKYVSGETGDWSATKAAAQDLAKLFPSVP